MCGSVATGVDADDDGKRFGTLAVGGTAVQTHDSVRTHLECVTFLYHGFFSYNMGLKITVYNKLTNTTIYIKYIDVTRY